MGRPLYALYVRFRRSDEALVEDCYRTILQRPPDVAGQQIHLHALASGMSRLTFIEGFLSSAEYHSLRGKRPSNKLVSLKLFIWQRLLALQKRAPATGKLSPEFVPAGHFYSVIPAAEQVAKHRPPRPALPEVIPGIELHRERQWQLLQQFQSLYHEWPNHKPEGQGRYRPQNTAFAPSDAILLYAMMRTYKPQRIIEIGSGWSSGVMAYTNEQFFGHAIDLTFIEPYPELLLSILKPDDPQRVTIIPSPVQEVPWAIFEQLEANDILFVDSTHVSKLDSDVNFLLFEVFPRLAKGVIIHIHDVFFPFEYPYEWLSKGMFWNEQYILRAFLQFNETFQILLFTSLMIREHRAWVEAHMPECLKEGGGLWLEKVQ